MRSLDTNCLLRLLVRDVPEMTARMTAIIKSGERLRVADTALIEMIYALETSYSLHRAEVAEVMWALMGEIALDFDRSLWKTIIETYVTNPKLSCTDIYLVLDAQSHDALPLLSFDKKLITQMGAVSP